MTPTRSRGELGSQSERSPRFLDKGTYRSWLILALLPAAYAGRGIFILWGRYFAADHAYWADPDYTYLYNGLLFATGNEIKHVDHPGTPLQLLNAALIWSLWKFELIQSETETLEAHALETADQYLLLISISLLIAQFVSIFLIGLVVKSFSSVTVAVAAQLPALAISLSLAKDLLSNKPEGFIFILSALTLLLCIRASQVRDSEVTLARLTLFASIFLGLAIALKISSIPMALLLPLLFREKKLILRTYGLTILFAIVFLSPVVFLYRSIIEFWLQFRGQAQSGFVETFLLQDTTVLFDAPTAFVAFLVALASMAYWIAQKGKLEYESASKKYLSASDLLRYSLVLAVFLLLQIALANSRGGWWIIPALPAASFALAIGLVTLSIRLPRINGGRLWAGSLLIVLTTVALLFAATASKDVMDETSMSRNEPVLAVEEQLRTKPSATVIYDWSIGWRKPPYGGQCGALVFAVGPEFSQAVTHRCPDTWLANFSYQDILPFGSNWTGCSDIASRLRSSTEIYLLKPALEPIHPSLETTYIERNSDWGLYEILDVNCPPTK